MAPTALNMLETELTDYSIPHRQAASGPHAENLNVDVIIVGGGFGKRLLPRRVVPPLGCCLP